MSSTVTGSPAGSPSTITTSALPWDSPAVRKRSTPRIYRPRVPLPRSVPVQEGPPEQHREHRAPGEERRERHRVLPAPHAGRHQREPDHGAEEEAEEQPEEHVA